MPAATRVLCCSCSLLPAYNLRFMTNAYPHSQHPSAMPLPLADRRGTSQGSCFLLHLLSLASASGLASCSNLSGTPCPAPTLRLAILFTFRKSSGAASQPFGHPCRAGRLDSLDLSFVLSHRRGCSPPRSDRKKGRPSEVTPSESRPRTVPQTGVGLLVPGPPLASLRFGPLRIPATRPFFNLPFSSGGSMPPGASRIVSL